MRWTLALLTSALLSSATMAQSLRPGWDSSLPQFALAPAIQLPVAAVGPASIEHLTTATTPTESLPPRSVSPTAAIAGEPTADAAGKDDGSHHFEKPIVKRDRPLKPRTSSAAKARHYPTRSELTSSFNRRDQTHRDVGRFWPPVF